MMEWTDRHCRYFLRLISKRTFLYTEMVTADAVLYGDRARVLGFSPAERPLALQLGGNDADKLAKAARVGADFGYDEINLNVGCPSDRVQSGRFGACLMAEPHLVGDCVAAMAASSGLKVTVKCRIGIDDQDEEEDFDRFIDIVARAGCGTFIVHARKAWLKGLSPKENRDIPPLDRARVHRLKQCRPELEIVINGGIGSLDEARAHLAHVDGVMLGRAAYADPYLLAEVDRELLGANETVRFLRQLFKPSLRVVRRERDGAIAARRARRISPLRRGRDCLRCAAQRHDAAYSWPVSWPEARSRLPPPYRRERPP